MGVGGVATREQTVATPLLAPVRPAPTAVIGSGGQPATVERVGTPQRGTQVAQLAPRPDQPGTVVSDAAPVTAPSGERQTPQSRIDEVARTVARELRAGNARGALDALHGVRLPDGDSNFETRMRDAIRAAVISNPTQRRYANGIMTALYSHLRGGERAMFDAYLQNPGGVALPHNRIYAAVVGAGANVDVIRDVFADIRMRHPNDPQAFDQEVAQVERDYVARYGTERGVTSLDQDLTEGWRSQLWGDDRVRYRAARVDSQDAFNLYSASEGTMWSTRGDQVLGALERNAVGIEAFANNYGYVVDNVANQGMPRLQRTLDEQLNPSDRARARLLTDTSLPPNVRARNYLNATMRDYLAGQVTAEQLQRSMRQLMRDPDNRNPDDVRPMRTNQFGQLDHTLVDRLAQSRDPAVRGMVEQLRNNDRFAGDQALVGEVQQMLRGGPRQRDALLSRLLSLTPEQRQMLHTAIPDFVQQSRRVAQIANGLDHGLLDAFEGRSVDAGSILERASRGGASVDDVIAAIRRHPNRAAFIQEFNQSRNDPGAFDRVMGRLGNADQSAVRMALGTLSATDQRNLDNMTTQLRGAFETQRAQGGWQGFSTWMNNRFGFAGPVVDDALREVVAAARDAGQSPQPTVEQAVRILRAHENLRRAMGTYAAEGREIANNVTLAAAAIVTVATLGAGIFVTGGVTAGMVGTSAVAMGTAAPAAHAVFEGNNYTAERAMMDALINGGGELVGGAAGLGIRRLLPAAHAATAGAR